MSKLEMPIRKYLQAEFNRAVNETAIENKGEDPFEAYVRLETHLGAVALGYDTYAQATITSGGHARNPDLDWIDIVKQNVAYAQSMAENLYRSGELDPSRTIEAATLGLISHWKEADYMTFWLNTLARPDVTGADSAGRVDRLRRNLERQLDRRDIDLDTFNSYHKSAPERAPYYMALADAYIAALPASTDYKPVDRLVAVSETGGSLGASTERYFAKKLGTKVFGLAIAQLGRQTLPANFPDPLLVRDTETIVKYGGQIFDPSQQTRILVVEQKS